MTYDEILAKGDEIMPGVVRVGARSFVVDVARALPPYLDAMEVDLDAPGVAVAKELLKRDAVDYIVGLGAARSGIVNFKFPKTEGFEHYVEAGLKNVDKVTQALRRLNKYQAKLDRGRALKTMGAK